MNQYTVTWAGAHFAIADWYRRMLASLAWRGDATSDERPRHALLVLLVSGSCGLLLGAQTGLQIPVESAQVLAGLVKYPADNPFYLYHVKTWTLLHQVCAILLACGLSERVISMMLGALLGCMAFEALSLCALATGRSWLLAIFVPLMCLGVKVFDEVQGTYIIYLLSQRPWIYYGAFGTSLVLMVWSLYGLGMRRSGALLMGLAPALHPAMGSWCLGIGAISLLVNWRQERAFVKPLATWLGIGLAISTTSFIYHLHQTRDLPSISPELRAQYVTAFAHGWDMHRQPYPLQDVGLYYGICAAVAGAIWLACLAREAASSVRFLIHALTIAAATGVGLALSTHVLEHLPTTLVMAMPGRYLNVAVLAFPAFALGLVARYGRNPTQHALLAAAVLYLALREFHDVTNQYIPDVHHILFMVVITVCGCAPQLVQQTALRRGRVSRALPWAAAVTLVTVAFWPTHHGWRLAATYILGAGAIFLPQVLRRLLDRDYVRLFVPLVLAACTACVASDVMTWRWTLGIGLALTAFGASGWARRRATSATTFRLPPRLAVGRWVTVGATACVAAGMLASETLSGLEEGYQGMHVWQSDPLLRRVHEGTGLVVIAPGVRGMQLRSRRPVLLGPLNQLPYVPESAPAMNHIVQRLFNDDLLKPRPPGHKPDPGGFDAPTCRAVWEARGPAEWQALAAEFGFTQVVTRPSWRLQVPLSDRSALWALYEVSPDGSPPAPPVVNVAKMPDNAKRREASRVSQNEEPSRQ